MAAPDLILHHYPRSPFAEKIRVAFGLKGLRWCSVEQPRIAPKPQLVPLTGGYRRIPVLQIGADIYCDTRLILAELERRFPDPSFYPPGTRGAADMIAGWADQALFATALGLVFGINGDRFPAELHADRASFTAGKFDGWNSEKMRPHVPSLRSELSHHLRWIDASLMEAGPFILGSMPSLADVAVYHSLWYLRGNLGEAEGLTRHPRVLDWMNRIAAIGHGQGVAMSTEAALSTARDAEPVEINDGGSEWSPGTPLAVTPTDWGFDTVTGLCAIADPLRVALRRDDPQTGRTVVHFPRIGFAVAPL
ncbi:glutathione S-transferase family protein [Tardiphaga alba]|uniref:Glutathione S-transferase family protein n=1 Tax=Tardiphaga alba TaxID=340268 RepID=A0ABX8A2U3_9BRAD|nr:glutathione S-transferase family protein [Tardiphaga alba]QUS37869.1 glutathione S-transferase family protein [Tardiphaga alba]